MRVWTSPAILAAAAVIGFASVALAQSDGTDAQLPTEIIRIAANSLAEQLDGRREYFEQNPQELFALIEEVLLPYFDTRYAGRLVLGKHWKSVSSEQRSEFIDAFYRFLLRSYAKGVLQFDQDRIQVLPATDDLDGKRTLVKTQMRLDDGTRVPVNYSMRKSSAGWRVYDVRIEGISYIQNYRNQFNAEIDALGVDAVIQRLSAENAGSGEPAVEESRAEAENIQ